MIRLWALCFGYALVRIWKLEPNDRAGLWGIGLSLCAMVLIKQIGILFAWLAIALMLVLGRWRRQPRAGLWLCCLTPLAALGQLDCCFARSQAAAGFIRPACGARRPGC